MFDEELGIPKAVILRILEQDCPLESDLSRIILARKNKFGSLTKEIISYYKLLCQYCYFLYLSLAYKEMPKLAKNKSISLSGTVG